MTDDDQPKFCSDHHWAAPTPRLVQNAAGETRGAPNGTDALVHVLPGRTFSGTRKAGTMTCPICGGVVKSKTRTYCSPDVAGVLGL